jgi:hypothetical protein
MIDDIDMLDHDYITLKLVNGETIICVLIMDDEEVFTVMFPICMKSVRIEDNGRTKEVMAGSPWSTFTDDTVFNIYKQDVIFVKPLNDATIEYYKNLVDLSEIDPEYIYGEDDPDEKQLEVETVNDFPDEFFFIPGNKTVN